MLAPVVQNNFLIYQLKLTFKMLIKELSPLINQLKTKTYNRNYYALVITNL